MFFLAMAGWVAVLVAIGHGPHEADQFGSVLAVGGWSESSA